MARGIPLFFLVFHCAGFGEARTKRDAAHSGTQSCARARANSTTQNIGKAIVQNGTAFMQNSTIRCNARALFLIVLNQYNAIPCETFACLLFLTVLSQALAILSSTIQCNGIQSCKSPPPSHPHPYPCYYYTFPHRKICATHFVERCSPLVQIPP